MSDASHYRLERPLAVGGMAELFLGRVLGAEGFEKPVAIKRMRPHLARDPLLARMFLAEARLSTHLQHQNIASVYDVGTSAEGLFLVMELVDGWDLGMLLAVSRRRGQGFPPHLTAFIGQQVLAGLTHAYRRRHDGHPVITAHRDVSPSNILISREGEVKVADFGIARIQGAPLGTEPGTFKGKVPYASPETLEGQPATAASDQFALGLVLHELLTGAHPFGEDALLAVTFARAIAQRPPAPLPPSVPAALRAVLLRALEPEPSRRFAEPEQMADALARYLAHAGEPASSHALAHFIAELGPPPTLLEQRAPAAHIPDLPSAPVHLVPAPPGAGSSSDEDWLELPGGPALSPTGQVVQVEAAPEPLADPLRCARCQHPLHSEDAACARCGHGLLDTVVSPPLAAESLFELATRDFTEALVAPPRTTLSDRPAHRPEPLSRVEGEVAPVDPRATSRRRGRAWVLLPLVLGLGGLVLWGLRPRVQPPLTRPDVPTVPAAPAALISIESTPSGATVSVEGEVVGTTPLFLDNTYPEGDITVRLTLKGHKPWKGTFRGGEPATLHVPLRR